jgi:hypothetical protein
MAWRIPGSQSRIAMKEKEALARHLIAQGLNNTQVSIQLRCSTRFVRDVRSTMEREGGRVDTSSLTRSGGGGSSGRDGRCFVAPD